MRDEKSPLEFLLLSGITIGLLLLSAPAAAAAQQYSSSSIPTTPTEFVKLYWPFAVANQSSTQVPALVTIAQAGLESGWGKHAPGFNFFGITAGKSWTGETQLLKTWECGNTGNAAVDGIKNEIIAVYAPGDPNGSAACRHYSYRVRAKFRKYTTPGQSFLDHGILLKSNTRYAAAFRTHTPEDFARAIAAAGYATLDTYATYLTNTMRMVLQIVNEEGISGSFKTFSWIDPGIPERLQICR